MKIAKIVLLTLGIVSLALLVGSKETTEIPEVPTAPEVPVVQIKPLYDHLIMAPQNWKDAYGDTLEARLIYNLAVLRNNQLEIAKMISRLHPPVDPNEIKLEKFDRSIIKEDGKQKLNWEWQQDVADKLDEIIEQINK